MSACAEFIRSDETLPFRAKTDDAVVLKGNPITAVPRVHEIASEMGVDSSVAMRTLKNMGELQRHNR